MPCNGDSSSRLSQAYADLERAAELINSLTSMLCELCNQEDTRLSPRIERWWTEHQKHDAERKEQEFRRDEEQKKRDLAQAAALLEKWRKR